MKLMPLLLSEEQDGQQVRLRLFVDSTLTHFSGHFPNQPILPGIVQTDWAVRFGERYFDLPRQNFSQIKGLKFSSPVLPETELTLELRWDQDKAQLEFSFHAGQRPCSSGKIVFTKHDARATK